MCEGFERLMDPRIIWPWLNPIMFGMQILQDRTMTKPSSFPRHMFGLCALEGSRYQPWIRTPRLVSLLHGLALFSGAVLR